MRKKFKAVPQQAVTIGFGDDALEFTLTALPVGYRTYLEGLLPEPVTYVDMKPVPKKDPEYFMLLIYLVLAKGMGDAEFDATAPTTNKRDDWERYARAIGAEFNEANFTTGDINRLYAVLGELDDRANSSETRRAAGNG